MTTNPTPALHAATVFDQAVLERLLSHPRGRELLALYAEETREIMRRLREAVARCDATAVREAAHSMKGSSQYIGATQVVSLNAALERQAREGLPVEASELMAQLERAFERVSQAITVVVRSS